MRPDAVSKKTAQAPVKTDGVVDAAIPGLGMAMDADKLKAHFEHFFQQQYGETVPVAGCRIMRVYHKPGKDCKILYRLELLNGGRGDRELLLFARLSGRKDRNGRQPGPVPAQWPGCGKWKPVTHWDDMNMRIHTFPYDPKLDGLGRLLEPAMVMDMLSNHLAAFGLNDGWRCQQVNHEVVKYIPEKRCVIRFKAGFSGPNGQEQGIEFYSKTYNNAAGQYVDTVMQHISSGPAYRNGLIRMPAPIAYLDEIRTVWQHACPGSKLGTLAREHGWPHLIATGLVDELALLIAALHKTEVPREVLRPGKSMQAMMYSAAEDCNDILVFFPGRDARLREISSGLQEAMAALDRNIPQTTIHGTLKLTQLLCDEGQLSLVDLDSIASGDPIYDLAELIASLEFLRFSDGVAKSTISGFWLKLVELYEQSVSWECTPSRLAWYVVVFMLGKIHSFLKRLEAGQRDSIDAAFDLLQEWLDRIKAVPEATAAGQKTTRR